MKLSNLTKYFTPTYNVLYAPDVSESSAPIQTYKVLGNPKAAAWKSSAGNRLFTLPVRNRQEEFRSFRADRCLSVTWALV